MTIKTDARQEFLNTLKEDEFSGLILQPLLRAMGFHEIRNWHGSLELGKDILFKEHNPLRGESVCAAVVKVGKISGSVTGNSSLRNVLFQIQQSLDTPVPDIGTGRDLSVDFVYLMTTGAIGASAIASVVGQLKNADRRRLQIFDGPRIIELCEQYVPGWFDSMNTPEARYLHQLLLLFQHDAVLSGAQGAKFSVNDVYTEGQVTTVGVEAAKRISFAAPDAGDDGASSLADNLLSDGTCIVLVADVGAGKTTALKHVAMQVARRRKAGDAGAMFLPIFVDLARVRDADVDNSAAFLSYVQSGINDQALRESAMRSSLVLFDGLDENPSRVDKIQLRISEFANSVAATVVATRPTSFPALLAGPRGFRLLRLLPFTNAQIQSFFSRWFGDEDDVQEALWLRVRSSGDLLKFCRTPLMLTLYCFLAMRTIRRPGSTLNAVETVQTLPVRRTDIYASIVEYLLGKWDLSKGVVNDFSFETKQHFLEALARKMMDTRERSVPVAEAHRIAVRCLANRRDSRSGISLVNEIVYRCALLRFAGADSDTMTVAFTHHSFQEYLAATQLHRGESASGLDKLLMDDWWRGTLFFFFGHKRSLDSINLSNRMFSRHRDVALRVFEFLAEADYTSSEQRDKLIALVSELIFTRGNVLESDARLLQSFGKDSTRNLVEYKRLNYEDSVAGAPLRVGAAAERLNVASYLYVLAVVGDEVAWKELENCQSLLTTVPPIDVLRIAASALDTAKTRERMNCVAFMVDVLVSRFPAYYRQLFHEMGSVTELRMWRMPDNEALAGALRCLDDIGGATKARNSREKVMAILAALASSYESDVYSMRDHEIRGRLVRLPRTQSDNAAAVAIVDVVKRPRKRAPTFAVRPRTRKR